MSVYPDLFGLTDKQLNKLKSRIRAEEDRRSEADDPFAGADDDLDLFGKSKDEWDEFENEPLEVAARILTKFLVWPSCDFEIDPEDDMEVGEWDFEDHAHTDINPTLGKLPEVIAHLGKCKETALKHNGLAKRLCEKYDCSVSDLNNALYRHRSKKGR